MDNRWGRCISLPFAVMGLASSASAQTATAGVWAEVVPLPESAAEVATEWLLRNSPGVFALRIPGSAQVTAIVTARRLNPNSGTFDFLMSSEGAAALQQLLTQMASSAEAAAEGVYQLSVVGVDGTTSIQGVQMILVKSEQSGDGSVVIVAILAFD